MQDCIRYIATEKRTKKRFVFSYDIMKSLGYRSLVHEYYNVKRRKDLENEWRKRSMSTHSERSNPPTFEPKNGFKTT